MLYFNLHFRNPLQNTAKTIYKGLGCKHGPIVGHKYYELELIKDNTLLLCFELSLSLRGRDHAGLMLSLGLLTYECNFTIYDSRHWDSKNNCWETPKGVGESFTQNPPNHPNS